MKRGRVRIVNCNGSPYEGRFGVVVREKENIMKNGDKCVVYIVRLDKPVRSELKEVGFPKEALMYL